jgi:hypothetical protein
MKRVFSSGDSVLVDLRRSVLEAADIPCEVVNRYGILDFFYASSPISIAPLELCVVRDEDYEVALAILAGVTRNGREPGGDGAQGIGERSNKNPTG